MAHILSTMGDVDLSIRMILEHGSGVFGDAGVVTFNGEGSTTASFVDIGRRAAQLANALKALGVTPGEAVATLQFNTQAHEEAYFAVPCMGAVLHTLNFRLHPDQLAWIINHAEDKVILCEGFLLGGTAGHSQSTHHGEAHRGDRSGARRRRRACRCSRLRRVARRAEHHVQLARHA